MLKKIKSYINTLKSFFVIALFVISLRTFVFSPYHIPSGSMKNTLIEGDYLIATAYSYGYGRFSLPFGIELFSGRVLYKEPSRGDIIIFRPPHDENTNYIKRCIGLPGDTIQIIDGVIFINGKEVERKKIATLEQNDSNGNAIVVDQYIEYLDNGRSYKVLHHRKSNRNRINDVVYRVPKDHFFFMGDNRDASSDSRLMKEMGFVPKENLIGKARMVIFSLRGKMDRFFINLNNNEK